MLPDELFRHRAFVHEPDGVQPFDPGPAEAADRVHQAHVHEKEFEHPRVRLGVQRQAARMAMDHFRQHTRKTQSFDVGPDGCRLVVSGEAGVLHLPAHVASREVQHVHDAGQAP